MGRREGYEHGTFSWTDLATPDVEEAKAFYGAIFGWAFAEHTTPAGPFWLCRIGDETVAGIFEMPPDMREPGAPTNWLSHITVDDAGAVAARAADLGGAIHEPAFDAGEDGRMALIKDPQGAMFSAWQPKGHVGAGLVNVPGALGWNELSTSDLESAAAFYTALFGWESEPGPDGAAGPGSYVVVTNRGRRNGGIRGMSPMEAGLPAHWLPYFVVPSAAAFAVRVGEYGGKVLGGPFPAAIGTLVIARDPGGAFFAGIAGDDFDG